jgi:putative membrane protein
VADEGIDSQVDDAAWEQAVAALTRELKAGRTAEGLAAAVEICGDVLAERFPPRPDNPNELPDEVVEIPRV